MEKVHAVHHHADVLPGEDRRIVEHTDLLLTRGQELQLEFVAKVGSP